MKKTLAEVVERLNREFTSDEENAIYASEYTTIWKEEWDLMRAALEGNPRDAAHDGEKK